MDVFSSPYYIYYFLGGGGAALWSNMAFKVPHSADSKPRSTLGCVKTFNGQINISCHSRPQTNGRACPETFRLWDFYYCQTVAAENNGFSA